MQIPDEEVIDVDGMDDEPVELDTDMVDKELPSNDEAGSPGMGAHDIDEDNSVITFASNSPDDVWRSNKTSILRNGLEVRVPPPTNPEDYLVFPDPEVSAILQKYDNEGGVSYLARLTDGRVDEVSGVHFFISTSTHSCFLLSWANCCSSESYSRVVISKQLESVARCLCRLTLS